MNQIESFWQRYYELEGLEDIRYTEAFQFGKQQIGLQI